MPNKTRKYGEQMGISLLPEECITHIISFTTPKDACRSSVLSRTFRSAAASDDVWRKFLPSECQDRRPLLSRKELYFHMCDHFLPWGDDDSMSLSLERHSGKTCWMIGAKALAISWKDDPTYWKMVRTSGFRFPEVAELLHVWWLDIAGRIETKLLSPQTNYTAYLVFKFSDSRGMTCFRHVEVTLRVFLEGGVESEGQKMYLVPPRRERPPYRERVDGWMEVKLGDFYNDNGDDGALVCNFRDVNTSTIKNGLIVGGIELRPA